MNDSVKDSVRALLDKQTDSGHHTWRRVKDNMARYGIGLGGISVIIAVMMIFFFLLYVVLPIFKGAEIQAGKTQSYPAESSLFWGVEEYGEIGYNLNAEGSALFFDTKTGQPIDQYELELPGGASVTSAGYADVEQNIVALGLSDGNLLFAKFKFDISYPDNKRKITPSITYPFGEDVIELSDSPIEKISASLSEDTLTLVAAGAGTEFSYIRFALEESFSSDGFSLEEIDRQEVTADTPIDFLFTEPTGIWVYAVSRNGVLQSFLFSDSEEKLLENEKVALVEPGVTVRDVDLLVGGISMIVADDKGMITQWFPVRGEDNVYSMKKVRDFSFNGSPIVTVAPEVRRKAFVALNENNELGMFFTSSHRVVLTEQLDSQVSKDALALFNPRANQLLVKNGQELMRWDVDNEHPDLSWSALWGKVWYENYSEPEFTWQSSASTSDFEAKFSLVPLSFGTLKAAFYAMLFAMPLAICGAIFTAYFMAPQMRQMVKPAVEIMEALPTVILGFLAGLWLAPALEEHLPGVFMLLIVMPFGIILFGLAWHFAPVELKHRIPDGWQAALLIPIIIIIGWLSMSLSYPVEQAFFDGNMPEWLRQHGITYDQRNSLVVGIAMGFAVIPTIFSIAEDAIFSVPRHLTNGSLALGASPWQTLVRVVLPTASPGIFSAVMIGMGRAVGETMIVLMATGNTPIMEANIFEGMRTLSANIAVEMPESEVGSSHYRVLFLAGFVLFVFTFVFNTVAEIVRHRLRRKYGSL
ncbi:ABC transporter permease subunit [Pleionea sp. CnH1-48]|uniref:ABC transporter permease subunit n=1 Tax=Pleionea sp. CnH1-48 TaxID=2954494 RepID=UPI0020976F6A|nr:ABC transporter permease subunit [Pleionea sp. CnH1-48]MCO7226749.1 ABC transporter permease subunit [Pleionea sp. CnH1-48]